MPVTRLEVENLRLYQQAELEPDPHINLIVGENASGKTTLLEALYLLGTGRSFRANGLDSLQTHARDFFRVSADFQPGSDSTTPETLVPRETTANPRGHVAPWHVAENRSDCPGK